MREAWKRETYVRSQSFSSESAVKHLHVSDSDRFAEHRRSTEKASNPRRFYHPTAVSDHFSLPDRSIKDIELIPLELINSNKRDRIRTARVGCLISKGKTLEPYGMNRRHEI